MGAYFDALKAGNLTNYVNGTSATPTTAPPQTASIPNPIAPASPSYSPAPTTNNIPNPIAPISSTPTQPANNIPNVITPVNPDTGNSNPVSTINNIPNVLTPAAQQLPNNDKAIQDLQKKLDEQIKKNQADIKTQSEAVLNKLKQQQIDIEAAAQKQLLSIRDFASKMGAQNISFDGKEINIDGTMVDPAKYGLVNQDGRFVGTPDQIASVYGLAPLRKTLETAGVGITYDANTGMVSANGIMIGSADQLGAQNINGMLYADNKSLQGIYDKVSQFNGVNPATGEMPVDGTQQAINPAETEFQKDQDTYQKSINDLSDQYWELMNNPPEDNSEAISKLLENVQGWKGVYSDQISSLIGQTLASTFVYEPANDPMFQKALKDANRNMMETLNARGMLGGTAVTDLMPQIYAELLPQFQAQALQNYNNEMNNKFKQIDMLDKINEQDYDKYYQYTTNAINQIEKLDTKTYNSFKDTLTTIHTALTDQITAKKDAVTTQKADIKEGYDMLNTLGYVNNEISKKTGLPVGTPSAKAKEALQKRYFELQDAANKFQETLKIKEIDNREKQKVLDASAAEKKKTADQKTKVGIIVANLASMSGADAMAEIQKNIGMLSDELGEQLPELISNTQARIKEDRSEANTQTRFAMQESNADARAKNTVAKESPYFAETNKAVGNLVATYSDNASKERYIRIPGSIEHNQIVEAIEQSPISDAERVMIYNFYGIPLPKMANK
jgi:hypothetical protein